MVFRFSFLLLLMACVPLLGNGITTAYTRYYDDFQIRSLGDYFGERSIRQGFRTLVLTDLEDSAGQYFMLRLENDLSLTADHLEIEVLRSDTIEIETIALPLPSALKSRWIYVGLTGDAWPGDSVEPVAWHVAIKDRNGQVLASWKSFLWASR